MNIIAKQVLSLWGFLILGIFPLFGQSTPIKALPPENITATSFEVRASATLPFSPPGYVFDVAYDSTFAESSFVPGFRRRRAFLLFSETTALVSELNPATTYYFRFVEVETASAAYTDKVFSNVQRVRTLDSPIPGSPDPRVSNITKTGFTLRWNPVPKADYYLVDIWSKGNQDSFTTQSTVTILTNKRVESTTFTIDNLRDTIIFDNFLGTTVTFDRYRYSVRAANSAGIGQALTCGGCTCIHTQPIPLQNYGRDISPPSGRSWTLDALPFGGLPQSDIRDSSYFCLLGNYYAYAFTVLNKPDQERLLDTVWVEVDEAYRSQLTCAASFSYNFPFPPSQLLLHLKRKEDVQYFIQQYGRDAVRYTWDFVPSSPMFYRYSLVNATTSTRVQNDGEMSLSITPNPSAGIATIALSLPAPDLYA
jgi:hypothetical protein